AHVELGGVIQLELLQDAQDLAGLLAVAHLGLGQLALGNFLKSQLNGGVAVLFLGLLLHHGAGACLDDSDRDDLAGFIEDLGHAQLLADNGLLHVYSSLIRLLVEKRETLGAHWFSNMTRSPQLSGELRVQQSCVRVSCNVVTFQSLRDGRFPFDSLSKLEVLLTSPLKSSLRSKLPAPGFSTLPYSLISMSTPAGRSRLIRASTVLAEGFTTSIRRL